MDHWQPIIAILIVSLAAFWISRHLVRTVRRGLKGQPTGCGTCSMNQANKKENKLVQLGSKAKSDT
ncbi:hypothetical protein Q31b_39840 [Novipirellula aureliae]|uniref:Uncharacterized protein n=1 Tax=Novipirellula aureliae TaxID=2527966 RepID=A0A5C6DV11_9BACT|nr:hypothetical protein [Novipirellula aureliae]TWU38906.1 hypothetical protein Q31b_39840 [Novipirellula aureliae]